MTPMEWWLPSGAGDSGCIEGALGAQPEALQFLNEEATTITKDRKSVV